MTNQANNPVQDDDGETLDLKPDIHQSLGSKKLQEEFDQNVDDLVTRIQNINDQVVELNRVLNRRNNNIVNDVTQIIHQVLHESNEVSQELTDIKQTQIKDTFYGYNNN